MLAYQIHMSKHHLALSIAMQCSSVPSNKLHQLSKDVVLVCHQIDCSQCQMIVPPIWCYCVEGQEVFEAGSPLRSLFIQIARGNWEFPIRYLIVGFKWQLVFRDWCSNTCVYGINQTGLIYYYFIERLSYNILYSFI